MLSSPGRALVLSSIVAACLSASTPAGADAPITPPAPISRLIAVYPERASGEHDVLLELLVAADGSVEDARVIEGQTPFTDAALAAATGFRFTPARRGDRPVRARIRASIHFTPPSPEPLAAADPPKQPEPPRARPLEVTVIGDPRPPGAITLGRAEVRVLPGAFGDPFRAIEALPGVTPATSGAPYFYVRGAPPGNVGYFLDDIRLPSLFHVLLGPAVLPPALIDRVELHPGGYPAQYGRFAGGVLTAKTRPPATELHAEGVLRFVDAGTLVETPLPGGVGSALVAARYSYTAPALALVTSDVRFRYYDYQARLTLDLTPRDRLTLFLFGAHDDSAIRREGVLTPIINSDFYRLDLRYDTSVGDRTKVTHGLTLGVDKSTGGLNSFTRSTSDFYDSRLATPSARDLSLAARSRVHHRLSPAVLLRAGADVILDSYTTDTLDAGPQSPWRPALFTSRMDLAAGLFLDAVLDVGRGVEITPGVRLDLWSSADDRTISADPRLALRVPIGDRVRLTNAVGLAHQPPGFLIPVPGLNIAGLGRGLQRSFQTSAGVEADLPLSFKASATLYHNAFFNLSDAFSFEGNRRFYEDEWGLAYALRNRMQGSAVGLELHVERKLSERISGFFSYTLSRSTRHMGRATFPARADRTHVFQGAVSWDLGRGFRLGARGTFLSGRPILWFDYFAVVAQTREPAFFRVDTRAEKRWTIGKRGYVSLVLEMLNTTLAKEPYGEGRIGPVAMPSIGVEGGL